MLHLNKLVYMKLKISGTKLRNYLHYINAKILGVTDYFSFFKLNQCYIFFSAGKLLVLPMASLALPWCLHTCNWARYLAC